jgi:hypothetical protein
VIIGVGFAVALAAGGWLLYHHLNPVPSSLVGVWENETPLLQAGPGEVRLLISASGLIRIQFDHDKYTWWGSTKLHFHLSGDFAEVWSEPERKVKFRFEVRHNWLTISDPEHPQRPDDVMVFRRVQGP